MSARATALAAVGRLRAALVRVRDAADDALRFAGEAQDAVLALPEPEPLAPLDPLAPEVAADALARIIGGPGVEVTETWRAEVLANPMAAAAAVQAARSHSARDAATAQLLDAARAALTLHHGRPL